MKASDVCPICRGPRKSRSENQAFPFCGPRCKLADLGSWLSGHYALGAEPAPDEDSESGRGKPN